MRWPDRRRWRRREITWADEGRYPHTVLTGVVSHDAPRPWQMPANRSRQRLETRRRRDSVPNGSTPRAVRIGGWSPPTSGMAMTGPASRGLIGRDEGESLLR